MSSTQSRTLTITKSNAETYLTASGSVRLGADASDCIADLPMFASSRSGSATLNNTAKDVLYPNDTVHPTRIAGSWDHYAGSSTDDYIEFRIDGTTLHRTQSNLNKQTSFDSIAQAVLNSTKSSTILYELHTVNRLGYTEMGDVVDSVITLYFTRYDFSATAGSNVSSASVSSSTGYDGDTITYSCVLADGATFDGWYDGSTRVSTSQSYTMTVSGADVVLTAVATMPVTTKTLSATYNGTQVSGFPKSVQSAVSLAYGGTSKGSIPLSGGTKTFSCGGKIANGAININGTNLNNNGRLMATDVVVTVG